MNFSIKIPKILKDVIETTGMATHSVSILDKNGNYTFVRWSAYYPNKKSITPSKVKQNRGLND